MDSSVKGQFQQSASILQGKEKTSYLFLKKVKNITMKQPDTLKLIHYLLVEFSGIFFKIGPYSQQGKGKLI